MSLPWKTFRQVRINRSFSSRKRGLRIKWSSTPTLAFTTQMGSSLQLKASLFMNLQKPIQKSMKANLIQISRQLIL